MSHVSQIQKDILLTVPVRDTNQYTAEKILQQYIDIDNINIGFQYISIYWWQYIDIGKINIGFHSAAITI